MASAPFFFQPPNSDVFDRGPRRAEVDAWVRNQCELRVRCLETFGERAHRVVRQIAETENYDLALQEAVYRTPAMGKTDWVLDRAREGEVARAATPSLGSHVVGLAAL